MRAGFAQFLAFSQDAADNRTFLAQGKLQMPVLALGGEATFGPMIGVVMRPRRQNLSSTSCIARHGEATTPLGGRHTVERT